MAKQKKDNTQEIPSVLAFSRQLVPSDGYMYGTTWDDNHESDLEPLGLIEKTVRGVMSARLKKTAKKDPAKLNMELANANIQTVDECTLAPTQDTLAVKFTLKVLGNVSVPSACNNKEFFKTYADAVKRYIEKTGFGELAYRYAYNIASGRFLWRNRLGAEQIAVVVKAGDETFKFDGYEFSLKNFDKQDDSVRALANKIADALAGKADTLILDVTAYAKVGAGQVVFPSEEFVHNVESMDKNDKSKVLYEVNDIAAMHSQKIGNALRCVDTWYPAFGTEQSGGPISAEPYGSVTHVGAVYRNATSKKDFYTLFDKFALGEALEDEADEHYVMSVLIRGGVFGGSSDKE